MTTAYSFESPSPGKTSPQGPSDIAILVTWWFVVAILITGFDLVSSRASYVSLYAIVIEHVWYAVLCTGLIGILYAERNKLLWCFISAIGGLIALGAIVLSVTIVSGLLAD